MEAFWCYQTVSFYQTSIIKFHSIVIRTGDTTFLATWDDTGNVGLDSLTKAELKEFTTSTGSDKGENMTLMLYKYCFIDIIRPVRSQTRNTNGNGRSSVQIETRL